MNTIEFLELTPVSNVRNNCRVCVDPTSGTQGDAAKMTNVGVLSDTQEETDE